MRVASGLHRMNDVSWGSSKRVRLLPSALLQFSCLILVSKQVKRTIPHPRFNVEGDVGPFDIGLVELRSRLRFSQKIRPICMPSSENSAELSVKVRKVMFQSNPISDRHDSFVGRSAVVTGWGALGTGYFVPPTELQEVDLKVNSKI